MKKRPSLYWLIAMIITAIIIVFNIFACFKGFCDFYSEKIYGRIADLIGRIMSIFPFALGEILMYAGAMLFLFLVILAILFIFLRKKNMFRRFAVGYFKMILILFLIILMSYTFNWIIPFRSSLLGIRNHSQREYSAEELRTVRNYMVEQININSELVLRDKDGNIILMDKDTAYNEVTEAMQGISDRYTRLKGYYPKAKPALCSDFLEWMWIGGYTYPYTMEITYNKYTDKLYFPVLLAHEESHHKGYYQENEANFLSFVSCVESDNYYLRYAAYLDMYSFFQDEYCNCLRTVYSDEEIKHILDKEPKICKQAWDDLAYASHKANEAYENEKHPMDSLTNVAKDIADEGWSMQEEVLSGNYYDDVVGLVLEYYEGILY
ncbi:MAG: DUF3810 family protein [Lachnospiraceae bacterium]|nr:DUF3810 family protein [Lachnospiraceae bacterium]